MSYYQVPTMSEILENAARKARKRAAAKQVRTLSVQPTVRPHAEDRVGPARPWAQKFFGTPTRRWHIEHVARQADQYAARPWGAARITVGHPDGQGRVYAPCNVRDVLEDLEPVWEPDIGAWTVAATDCGEAWRLLQAAGYTARVDDIRLSVRMRIQARQQTLARLRHRRWWAEHLRAVGYGGAP